jgi:hypothetical protein
MQSNCVLPTPKTKKTKIDVRTAHFGMKLYNDQRNAQFLIYLSIYFCLTCIGLSFSPFSEAGVQFRQWFKSPGYGISARALTPYPGDLLVFHGYFTWDFNF